MESLEFGLKCMEGRSFTSRALKASQLETLNMNSAQVTNTAIGCLRDRVQEGHPVGGKNTTWPAGTADGCDTFFLINFPASIFLLVPTSKKDLSLPFKKTRN